MSDSDPIKHIIDLKEQVGGIQQSLQVVERERQESKQSQKELTEALHELTNRMNAMPDEDHREHHQFIQSFIEDHRQRKQIREAVIQRLTTGGVWAFFCGIATLIWYGIQHKFGAGH